MTDPSYSSTPPSQPPLTQSEDIQWASFAHLGGIIGFIPALVIWLVFKDRGTFTNGEGKEALNFQITVAIAYVICSVLSVVIIGAFLLPIVWILAVVFSILGFLKAKDGIPYRYPVNIRFIK